MFVLLFTFLAILQWSAYSDVPRPKKKHNQEVKVKADSKPTTKTEDILSTTTTDILGNLNSFTIDLPASNPSTTTKSETAVPECPPCLASNKVKSAIESFWNNDLTASYACVCNQLLVKKEDGFAQAIQYHLSQSKYSRLEHLSSKKIEPPSKDAPMIKSWEVLGPINVGKLEVDADPTFNSLSNADMTSMDPGQYLLAMAANTTVYSDLIQEGKIQWQTIHAKKAGDVDLHFSVAWNEIGQAMGNSAIYEFQGWARATTYARVAGSHIISCQGVHSMYVRNDNLTRILISDVYRSNQVHASVDLKIGLVGIVVPVRGVGQSNFYCQIIPPSGSTILLHPPKQVPDLLELSNIQQGKGLMVSSMFALPVHNISPYPLTLKYSIEKPLGEEHNFVIREVIPPDSSLADIIGPVDSLLVPVSPGQTMVLSLEILAIDPKNKTRPLVAPFVSCQKNRPFTLTVIPSSGQAVKTSIEFPCRKQDQSFTVSFLDHDHTVSHAAIIMPQKHFYNKKPDTSEYPVLLTMHGSGISAASNADAYKMMPKNKKDYTFGVDGYFVVSPSRFGAHNWESVGELTAKTAVTAARSMFRKFDTLNLPLVSEAPGIMAGHSMGGHGAWVAAMNSPDQFVCVSPGSGWIKKEEYATANAFFSLDIHNSYVDSELKFLFEKAMGEYHVDKLVSNLKGMKVHTRVGSVDHTTHPWYSRRMHRLLLEQGIDSSLEEVLGKQHWWWDTLKDNDGGVVNDPKMREFYAQCLSRTNSQEKIKLDYLKYIDSTDGNTPQSWLMTIGKGSSGVTKDARQCERNVSLVLFNPGTHAGQCGAKVLQQLHSLSRSSVQVTCSDVNVVDPNSPRREAKNVRHCQIVSANVAKLQVSFGFESALFGADKLFVNNKVFNIDGVSELQLCWTSGNSLPTVCDPLAVSHPLLQKSLNNMGPIRQIYTKSFVIVYGSPQNQALRTSMRDLAVYIGNSHYASHTTSVRVMSDLEYISTNYARKEVFSNIMFVGGPSVNKLLRLMLANNISTAAVPLVSDVVPTQALLPGSIEFGSDDLSTSFNLSGRSYRAVDQGIVFSLPIYRPAISVPRGLDKPSALGMGVILHANSIAGYLHLSRLAWPVVPPMVRSPFANYIPEYIVINSNVWSRGFGGVLAAGYWGPGWNIDPTNEYVNEIQSKFLLHNV